MPLAGRDVKAIVILRRTEDISIHAPLAGRDLPYADTVAGEDKFQSTRPLRSATLCQLVKDDYSAISIHAPLAGRDRRRGL